MFLFYVMYPCIRFVEHLHTLGIGETTPHIHCFCGAPIQQNADIFGKFYVEKYTFKLVKKAHTPDYWLMNNSFWCNITTE